MTSAESRSRGEKKIQRLPDCARAAVCTLVSAALLSGNPDSEVATAASGSLLAVAKADQIKRSAGWLLSFWSRSRSLAYTRALVLPFRLAPAAAHERVVPAADAEASELSSGRSDRTHEPLVIGECWWLASARCRGPGLLGA